MSAFERFRGHVKSASNIAQRKGSAENSEALWLHKYKAENGVGKVCVVPLEKIVWGGGKPDPNGSLWRQAAQKAEDIGYNG